MQRNQEMTTQQMDFMLSEAMLETRWMPLHGSLKTPVNASTASGFVNTIPCVRTTVPLAIEHKPTLRQLLEAAWLASIDWTIDHIDGIVLVAFLLALAAAVV